MKVEARINNWDSTISSQSNLHDGLTCSHIWITHTNLHTYHWIHLLPWLSQYSHPMQNAKGIWLKQSGIRIKVPSCSDKWFQVICFTSCVISFYVFQVSKWLEEDERETTKTKNKFKDKAKKWDFVSHTWSSNRHQHLVTSLSTYKVVFILSLINLGLFINNR